MAVSGIGVQKIMPKSGTRWREADPSRDRESEADSDPPLAPDWERAPAAPGTGRIVDKIT